jgi:hypothetical protein
VRPGRCFCDADQNYGKVSLGYFPFLPFFPFFPFFPFLPFFLAMLTPPIVYMLLFDYERRRG